MFHIGKRVIKTGLAVVFCLLIYIILMVLDRAFGLDRNVDSFAPTNWYTPFFATIATVYAMQNNPQGSISQAKIRSIGSVVGGVFGAVIIFVFEYIYLLCVKETDLSVVSNRFSFKILEFAITTIGIIFMIPFTVKIKWPQATFISCLTYLSVTISIRNGGMNVFFFAFNRILSTVIGVLISLYINTFPHFRTKNKDIMFVSSLDNALLSKDATLSPFSKFKMNDLINDGCSLTFMTTRALTSLSNIFKDVHLNSPIIVMNGVTVYHPNNREYSHIKTVPSKERETIENILNNNNSDYFTYLINRGVLNCYFNKLEHEGALRYYNDRKNGVYYSFSEAITPKSLDVIQYVTVEKNEIVEKVVNELKKNKIDDTCTIVTYPYNRIEGYSFLKIHVRHASKNIAIDTLKQNSDEPFLFVVGSGRTDIKSMEMADFAVCLNNAPDYVKEHADYILDTNNPEELLKFIANVYHKKNYKGYLNSLIKSA